MKIEIVGIAAILGFGLVYVDKLGNLGGDGLRFLETRTSEYFDRTKEIFSDTTNTLSKFIPFGYEEERPLYIAEQEILKAAPQDVHDFKAASSYDVGGYRDVSKIGTTQYADQAAVTKGVQDYADSLKYRADAKDPDKPTKTIGGVDIDRSGFGGSW